MEFISRKELKQRFNLIVDKYGKPKGEIICYSHLISKVVEGLAFFDECNIIYEKGVFKIRAFLCGEDFYLSDYAILGNVRADNWFSKEQLKALHELLFGY